MLNISADEDFIQRKNGLTCCLMDSGLRCKKAAGNACYNKRIQKTIQQRRLHFFVDEEANHTYICESHKSTIQNFRNQQKSKEAKIDNMYNCENSKVLHTDINFFMLPLSLLRRYKRNFKLIMRPGSNKAQLAELVAKHFGKLHVDQKEVLTQFLITCKHDRVVHHNIPHQVL